MVDGQLLHSSLFHVTIAQWPSHLKLSLLEVGMASIIFQHSIKHSEVCIKLIKPYHMVS